MAFDLYIRIAGLCLLGRRRDELLVLVPPTAGHAGHGHGPDGGHGTAVAPHVAVIGARPRYVVGSGAAGDRFVEHVVGDGAVEIDLDTDDGFESDLARAEVMDISEIAGQKPDSARARVWLSLRHGAVCPPDECEPVRGGEWDIEVHGKVTRTFMAPQVVWKVAGVRNQVQVDGKMVDGLAVRSKVDGEDHTFTLQAVDGSLALYLVNVPDDERPSRTETPHRTLEQGDREEHFAAYYDLFPRPAATPLPVFVGDGSSELRSTVRALRFSLDYGCALASADA